MNSELKPTRVWYETLDTSFVNLWALLRFLTQKSFTGRVHVEMENYSADVFMNGSAALLVHEVDRESGSDVTEEAALHRLVLRARETPGTISVYAGADEAIPESEFQFAAETQAPAAALPEAMRSSSGKDESVSVDVSAASDTTSPTADEWNETSRLSGELIAAVERAAVSLGADFDSSFRNARIALADDYTFLDPVSGSLRYENSTLVGNRQSAPPGYIAGISESLTRAVNQIAQGDRERRARERVALELARVARKNSEAIKRTGFADQLDRIAGTKVI